MPTPKLYMLRGAPGSGKSSWVHGHGFDSMTVSSDDVRLDLNGLCIDKQNGKERISQDNPGAVWDEVHRRLDELMDSGGPVILDSTALRPYHITQESLRASSHGYELVVVPFSTNLQDCLERNSSRIYDNGREAFREVPPDAVGYMYDYIASNDVPINVTQMTPEEACEDIRNNLEASRGMSAEERLRAFSERLSCSLDKSSQASVQDLEF